jgi:hypothetical protein
MSILPVHAAYPYCMSILHVHAASNFCMSLLHVQDACQRCIVSFRGNPTIRLSYFVSFRLATLAKFRRNRYFVISFRRNFAEISPK